MSTTHDHISQLKLVCDPKLLSNSNRLEKTLDVVFVLVVVVFFVLGIVAWCHRQSIFTDINWVFVVFSAYGVGNLWGLGILVNADIKLRQVSIMQDGLQKPFFCAAHFAVLISVFVILLICQAVSASRGVPPAAHSQLHLGVPTSCLYFWSMFGVPWLGLRFHLNKPEDTVYGQVACASATTVAVDWNEYS